MENIPGSDYLAGEDSAGMRLDSFKRASPEITFIYTEAG